MERKRPGFGPKPQSRVWNKLIARDIKVRNMELARQIRMEKIEERKLIKNEESI